MNASPLVRSTVLREHWGKSSSRSSKKLEWPSRSATKSDVILRKDKRAHTVTHEQLTVGRSSVGHSLRGVTFHQMYLLQQCSPKIPEKKNKQTNNKNNNNEVIFIPLFTIYDKLMTWYKKLGDWLPGIPITARDARQPATTKHKHNKHKITHVQVMSCCGSLFMCM